MRAQRNILTLTQLRKEYEKEANANREGTQRLFSTIGLIIDCSNVYRYEANRDYTQKFKIIDQSNPNQVLQVYIWSNRKQDFVFNIKVGDILFINNFKVQLYKDNLQAKKAYKVQDSYFRIFNGNPQISNYSPVDKRVGLDDEEGKILSSLNTLRNYSKTYFKNNRVPVVFKQDEKETKGKVDQKKITSSDFDVILRVIDYTDHTNHFRIRLTNEKNQFFLNYTRSIEPGVYKLRSIADQRWEEKICYLSGNDYTFFLEISSWMKSFDAKEWDKIIPGTDANKKKVRRAKIESKILSGNKKIKKMTLKQLFNKDEHESEVRVSCEIMDICTAFEDALKRYDPLNNTEKHYQSQTGQYIYSIHLLLSDQSLVGQVCNAYIYTYDKRGLEFLPDLHPKSIYGRNIIDMKQNYDNFVNRVLEESDDKECPVELILSPLYNGKQTIYRIVDTQLLF